MIILEGDSSHKISFISAGQFRSQGNWIHPKRVIDSYELMYVLEGTVYIREEEAEYMLSKGDLLILTPGKTHSGIKPSEGKTSFYWAHFRASDYQTFGLESSYYPSSMNIGCTEQFARLLHIANTPGYPKYAVDLMIALILSEISFVQHEKKEKSSKLIREVTEWVRINSDIKLTVESVAEHFGYHSDYLSGIFKKACGIGLKQYISGERLKNCKNLLLSTQYSVKQISAMMGWQDENQMIHFFKFHEKMSPTAFRNSLSNTHLNKK